jgi:hypothetical protein
MLKANGGDFPSDPEALPNALAMSPRSTILPMSLVGTCPPAAEAVWGISDPIRHCAAPPGGDYAVPCRDNHSRTISITLALETFEFRQILQCRSLIALQTSGFQHARPEGFFNENAGSRLRDGRRGPVDCSKCPGKRTLVHSDHRRTDPRGIVYAWRTQEFSRRRAGVWRRNLTDAAFVERRVLGRRL